jgi:aryl-alcohol dehydrogenase-like predicted oxidoreductase
VRLGLGTVQFGLDYGVANEHGRTAPAEVAAILALAAARGIELLDTAAGYGESEAALGAAMLPGHGFRVVTKSVALEPAHAPRRAADQLERGLLASLERLRLERVHGLLIHRADDLLGEAGPALMARMGALRDAGLVERIGVSVYDGAQIDALLADFDLDLIQVPVSLLDQRLVHSGHLARLKRRGVEIHARSAFLQGLLLMPAALVPAFFEPIRSHLEACRARFEAQGVSALEAALAFLDAVPEIDIVVCGVNDARQLAAICAAAAAPVALGDGAGFALREPFFLNPGNWRT